MVIAYNPDHQENKSFSSAIINDRGWFNEDMRRMMNQDLRKFFRPPIVRSHRLQWDHPYLCMEIDKPHKVVTGCR